MTEIDIVTTIDAYETYLTRHFIRREFAYAILYCLIAFWITCNYLYDTISFGKLQ